MGTRIKLRSASLAALLILAAPAAQAAGNGGFNGYRGWGGLFRPNNDVGWGPQYFLGFIVEEPEVVVVPRPAPPPHRRRAIRRRCHRASPVCAPPRPVRCQTFCD
jgi:hypothetical protein